MDVRADDGPQGATSSIESRPREPSVRRVLGRLGLAALAAAGLLIVRRRQVTKKLDKIEAHLTHFSGNPRARPDVPAQVVELALRLGSTPDRLAEFVTFTQSGLMWRSPDSKSVRFRARQAMATVRSGFIWRATMNPFRALSVADYFHDGNGGLVASVFNLVPIADAEPSATLSKGQMLRYLAELPWNPDAMLANADISWSVEDETRIIASIGQGAERAEIAFSLNDQGLIIAAHAKSRLYLHGDIEEERPWHGRFWDYQDVRGYRIPMQAEVAWVLGVKEFVYFRCMIESWRPRSFSGRER